MRREIVQFAAATVLCTSGLTWAASDLVVSDIELIPALPAVSTGLLRATINNIGPDETGLPFASQIGVEFYLDGVICDSETVAGDLNSGESVTSETTHCNPDIAGTYNVTVIVDSDFDVAESNEANNDRIEPFEWAEAGPVVIFDTDFALPAMPGGDGTGTPVCVDEASGLLVAGCDVTITGDQIDPNSVQKRVTGTCTAGYSIRVINSNGTVTCEQDTDTDTHLSEAQVDSYVANNGYSTGPHTVDTTLNEAQVDSYVANNNYSTGAHTVDTTCSLSDCIYPGRATLTCGATSVTVNCVVPTAPWTARSAEASSWYSVAYGGGLFVAVATIGTNRVMTSPDGITWTAHSATEANAWLSVTYGDGLFVAVSYDGANRVMTSPDGVNWTARSAAEANGWAAVTYGEGLFVAVSYDGTNRVMTSPDGINWTARSAAEPNQWRSVTYSGGLFVAVAASGTNRVMTSPDGITWTARSATEDNQWLSVTYGDGLFVAVSYDGENRVMTSRDAVNWTARSAAEASQWTSVTYGDGLFVAVSRTGANQVMTSPDGITWTAQAAAEANYWWSVIYGGGKFVAVSSTGTYRVMTSP